MVSRHVGSPGHGRSSGPTHCIYSACYLDHYIFTNVQRISSSHNGESKEGSSEKYGSNPCLLVMPWHLLMPWPWANHFPHLDLSFLIFKMMSCTLWFLRGLLVMTPIRTLQLPYDNICGFPPLLQIILTSRFASHSSWLYSIYSPSAL